MTSHNPLTFFVLFCIILGHTTSVLSAEDDANVECVPNTSASFASKLFTTIGSAQDGNVVFSPFGIRNAMGIAGLGADGNTRTEIAETMQLKSLQEEFPTIVGIYTSDVNEGKQVDEKEENRDTANLPSVKENLQILVKKGVKVDKEFLAVIKEIKGVDCKEFDADDEFLSHFPETNLENAQLIVHDTIKFSGHWTMPFSSVCSLPFHLEQDKKVLAVFITSREQFFAVVDFGESYGFSLNFVRRGESHPNFAMFFIVPKKIDGIDNIVQGISEGLLSEWITMICNADNPKSYKLYVPRFSVNTSLELKENLISMGMKDAFTSNADFSKLSRDTSLSLTSCLHSAQIDVDEYGVEASAETAIFAGSIGLRRLSEIKLDRPFVYLIYDKSRRQVLFMGRCSNPVSPGDVVPNDGENKLTEDL